MSIRPMLDDDLYKWTMLQAVLKIAPDAIAKYRFINRGGTKFSTEFFHELQDKIGDMTKMKATDDELKWLGDRSFFKTWFIDYAANYRYDPQEVTMGLSQDGALSIDIDGPWRSTILWEVKLMALISELYFKHVDTDWSYGGQVENARAKKELLRAILHAEFGTRRRRSYENQEMVVDEMMTSASFIGTSNMHLARTRGLKCIGTVAHEWTQAMSALFGLRNANRFALDTWVDVYGGDLGIALPDTFGSAAFFGNFDTRHAKLWDGLRHDSGDPFEFADRVIAHYKKLGIDPMTKTIVFSDGLDPMTAIRIANYCLGKIKCAFGIGTNLTNDFEGSPALNMVIKLRQINGIEVVKLSDSPGKATGDPEAIRVANWTFNNTPLD